MQKEADITRQSPQKVLVTGGGGFLGQAIVKLLVRQGDMVRSFSRKYYPELNAMGVEQVQGDISDKIAVDRACKGMELIFHVAAKPGIWGDYNGYYQTNVMGTENVIAGCINNNVSRLVYTSSPSVVFNGRDMEGVDESAPYPERFHAHYPATKALAEQLVVKAAGDALMTVVLRPHLIWGPRDNHLVPRIIKRAKRLVKVGNGKNLVDTIYIDNAAEAHVLAAESLRKKPEISGKTYFISQDEPMPVWEMVNAILAAAGLDPVRRSIPHWIARLIGFLMEFFYHSFNLTGEPRMTRFLADELATAHWFDISAAKRDLGYFPRISTAQGLHRLEQWLQKNGLQKLMNP